jgi:hypothetical protein
MRGTLNAGGCHFSKFFKPNGLKKRVSGNPQTIPAFRHFLSGLGFIMIGKML